MIRDIHRLIRSGYVTRWHQNPDMNRCGENLAQHQWLTAMFVLYLKPDASMRLLVRTLTHDVGELDAGDLSFTTKCTGADWLDGHVEAEVRARHSIIDGWPLDGDELRLLKLADRMAAYEAMMRFNPSLAERDDWREAYDTIYDIARGISGTVAERVGNWRNGF